MSKEYSEFIRDLLASSDDPQEVEQALSGLDMIPVDSSNLAAVNYNKRRKQLIIAFLDGSVYLYVAVPEAEYLALMKAESHGSYFYYNIRDSYDHERIAG